jgi:hypothetical protein
MTIDIDAIRQRAEEARDRGSRSRYEGEPVHWTSDVLALLDALQQADLDFQQADLDALFIQTKAECERDRLAAENAKMRSFLQEIGKATCIEWSDDIVNDPASWVAGALDAKEET